MTLRNRVIGLEHIKAGDLIPHPKNWRLHSREQRDALKGILAEVGIADALLVRKRGDGYQIIDGHCRAEETPDTEWPCLVLDLTDKEADKLLATFDPLAAMAEADADALRSLLESVQSEDEALGGMLNAMREHEADSDAVHLRQHNDEPLMAYVVLVEVGALGGAGPMLDMLGDVPGVLVGSGMIGVIPSVETDGQREPTSQARAAKATS